MCIHLPIPPRRKLLLSFLALVTMLVMGATSSVAATPGDLPPGGSAADFTFIVPIDLRNLHESVRSVYVYCEVKLPGGSGVDRFNNLGSGGLHLPVRESNGSIARTGTIRITVAPNSRQHLSRALEWQCMVSASTSVASANQTPPADAKELRIGTNPTNMYTLRTGSPVFGGALIARGTF